MPKNYDPIMYLIDELREKKVGIPDGNAKVMCKVIKDNTGARIIALIPRIRPRTKCINNVEHVEGGSAHLVKSEDHLAIIFTKPLPAREFEKLRDIIVGITTALSTSEMQGSVMNNMNSK